MPTRYIPDSYPVLSCLLHNLVDDIPLMAETLDSYDRRLLGALQQDATLSTDALAERVHLSRNACWRRVKRLEEAGILQRRVALVDPAAVGVPLLVLVLIRTRDHSAAWLARFRAAVAEMPEIVGAERMSGDLDYVLRIRVADVEAYDRVYKRLIAKIDIADVSASFVMETLKETTAVPI